MPKAMTSSSTILRRVLAAVLFAVLVFGAVPLAADELNRIVLRVNEQILTLHEYEKRKAAEITAILSAQQIPVQERQQRIAQTGPRILQDMFRELLLMSRAKQLRVFISDDEVEQAVRDLATSRGIQDPAQLEQALAASGMTVDDLRARMRREMTWNQVVGREVTSKIDVGPEVLRAFYRANKEDFSTPEKRWLKEVIVLESSGKNPEELQELAAQILGKLVAGAEFAAVVEPYKEAGETSGVIDLDWLEYEELDSVLADVAFKLEPGAYSEPVSSRGGLHIIHLAGLEEGRVLPFEEVEGQIMRRERGRRFDQELRTYLAGLERNAYIQEDLPPEAVGYRNLADEIIPEDELELFRQPELPKVELDEDKESGR